MKDKKKKKKAAVVMEVNLCHQMEKCWKLINDMHEKGFHPINMVFAKFDPTDSAKADLEMFVPEFMDSDKNDLAQQMMSIVSAAIDLLPGTVVDEDVIQ